MNMRPLIINDEVRALFKVMIEEAEKNKIPISEMKELHEKQEIVGENPKFDKQWCVLEFGYRIFFTIEEHPAGWCRHISISVDSDAFPNPASISLIMNEFGFENGLSGSDKVYIEPAAKAINVIDRIEPHTNGTFTEVTNN
jgi:hypothetical protein